MNTGRTGPAQAGSAKSNAPFNAVDRSGYTRTPGGHTSLEVIFRCDAPLTTGTMNQLEGR